MKTLALLIIVSGLAAAQSTSQLYTLGDALERVRKITKLSPAPGPLRFKDEKSFDAKLADGDMASAIRLNFLDDKLAKIVWTFDKTAASSWKPMIDLRRGQHKSLAPCVDEGIECWEWDERSTAERLTYDPEASRIVSTLIDKAAYKKAAAQRKKKP